MKKYLLIILFSFFYSNNSFADQWFDLVQFNCYEKSGYFELRKIGTWNLNMWEVAEDENLVNLQHSKNVTKTTTKIKKSDKMTEKYTTSTRFTTETACNPVVVLCPQLRTMRTLSVVHHCIGPGSDAAGDVKDGFI